MAEAGTLKPDFRVLKCRNPVFFSWNTFSLHIIEIPKEQKPCWPYKRFNSDSSDENRNDFETKLARFSPINILERLVLFPIFSSKYRELTETPLCLVPG